MKGVIFDFNGTLFLDNDKHMKAWGEVARQLRGRPIDEEELHAHLNGVPNIMAIRYLNGGQKNEVLEKEWSYKKEEYYRQFCAADKPSFHLIKGAEELFNKLESEGVPFTIASASIKPNIDFFVESFQLDRWIDPADIVYDDGTYANKEAMFEKAAGVLGLPLKELTVIEDSLAGVNAALNTGVEDIRIINSGNIADQVSGIPQVQQICNDMSQITA